MEFDASLPDLIVYHEQFFGKDNQQLRLLSTKLKQNQSVPLILPNERQSAARLSVIKEQDFKRRQEFSVKVNKKKSFLLN